MIRIQIQTAAGEPAHGQVTENSQGELTAQAQADCTLAISDYHYQAGDHIHVSCDQARAYLVVQLDESLPPSLVYLPEGDWTYQIPLDPGERRAYPSTAFESTSHAINVRLAQDHEIAAYQNLSLNPHDQRQASGAYPHVSATAETRGDAGFWAKNVINGLHANRSHGQYPYGSWGIDQKPDASLTIDFGRPVELDRLDLLLRADFPHDSYWTEVSLAFSDGSLRTFPTERTGDFQVFTFPPVVTSSVRLFNLRKAPDDSPFPSLSEIDLYGKNVLS